MRFTDEEYARAAQANADREELQEAQGKLAEAETTIGALKHLIGEQADEIAELRADLEWAVKHGAEWDRENPKTLGLWWLRLVGETDGDVYRELVPDASPEDLRRVIRKARKGE